MLGDLNGANVTTFGTGSGNTARVDSSTVSGCLFINTEGEALVERVVDDGRRRVRRRRPHPVRRPHGRRGRGLRPSRSASTRTTRRSMAGRRPILPE